MSRKDIIFETLKRQCELAKLEKKDLQIESSDLADALGYDRSNVSRDLNELVRRKSRKVKWTSCIFLAGRIRR